MATPILMPKLSFVVTQGTIIEWLKKPGDMVSKGEPLLVIESEKATVDVESPGSGVVGPSLAPEGTTVPVTTIIGYILEPGESPPKLDLDLGAPIETQVVPEAADADREREAIKSGPAKRIKASPSAKRLAKEQGVELSRIIGTGPGGRIIQDDVEAYVQAQAESKAADRVHATPVARRLASELGIDLKEVQGSGPGGRVVKEDITRALQRTEAAATAPATGIGFDTVDLTTIQRITADRMSLSFGTAPHFYLAVQVDMSQVVAMREALLPAVEAVAGVRLSFSDVLLYVTGRALAAHPALNASFEGGQLRRYHDVNLCLAVDTPRGLTVPVFHKADEAKLAQLAKRRSVVVQRARDNRLLPEDLSGGTFTISNLGMFGIDVFNAIINPPQAAILAVGRITKRPVVVADALELRSTMWMSLSVDHRVADGATAARFLDDLVGRLEAPYEMLV